MTETAFIIAAVLYQEPLHGYGVAKVARSQMGVDIVPGTLYRNLQEMEEHGWLEKEAITNHEQRTWRYYLTRAGYLELKREMERKERMIAWARRSLGEDEPDV